MIARGAIAAGLALALAAPGAAADPANEFQYLYGSAEAAAASRQVYHMLVGHARARAAERAAGRPLVQVVLAPGATLDRPLFEACGDKPLAAVFDVDETLLLNVGFEYWDATRTDRSVPFADVWGAWERSGADKVAAVPGALDAVSALRAAGVAVIYNTNRDAETAGDTARALEFAGFGKATPGEDLFTDAAGDSKKDGRRAEIASRYCVIALVGDQLGDISDLFNASGLAVPQRRAAVAAPALAAMWGEGWFVLPNPVYGPSTRGSADEVFPDPALRWTYPGEPTR
ncbi:MAG TPA: HAD family acid phosphatase [Croceibacterium sp.]|nr:HAD family acid phosphatase [Croceibacterium sp.]